MSDKVQVLRSGTIGQNEDWWWNTGSCCGVMSLPGCCRRWHHRDWSSSSLYLLTSTPRSFFRSLGILARTRPSSGRHGDPVKHKTSSTHWHRQGCDPRRIWCDIIVFYASGGGDVYNSSHQISEIHLSDDHADRTLEVFHLKDCLWIVWKTSLLSLCLMPYVQEFVSHTSETTAPSETNSSAASSPYSPTVTNNDNEWIPGGRSAARS